MNYAIWKYPLKINDTNTIDMPEGARILCVQIQNGGPCLWALVDTQSPIKVPRVIETFGTGHPMNDSLREYIGTYQLHDGALVFHVFEQTDEW